MLIFVLINALPRGDTTIGRGTQRPSCMVVSFISLQGGIFIRYKRVQNYRQAVSLCRDIILRKWNCSLVNSGAFLGHRKKTCSLEMFFFRGLLFWWPDVPGWCRMATQPVCEMRLSERDHIVLYNSLSSCTVQPGKHIGVLSTSLHFMCFKKMCKIK